MNIKDRNLTIIIIAIILQFFCFLAAGIPFLSSVRAAETGTGQPEPAEERLQDLIDTALVENHRHSELEYELEAARQRQKQLESGLDWQADIRGDVRVLRTPEMVNVFYDSLQYLDEEDNSPVEAELAEEVDDEIAALSLTLGASRSLWDDGDTAFRREALKLEKEDKKLELTREEEKIISSVAEAFYELRQAQVGLELAEIAAEVRREQVEEKRHLIEAEKAIQTELEEVKLQADEAEDALKDAREAFRLSRENLRREVASDSYLRLPEPRELDSACRLDVPGENNFWPWEIEESQDMARDRRRELDRLEQELDLIAAEREKIEEEQRPDLAGGVSFYQDDIDTSLRMTVDETGRFTAGVNRFDTTLPEIENFRVNPGSTPITWPTSPETGPINYESQSSWQIGFSLEYNFHDSGLEEAEMAELESERSARKEQLAGAEEDIKLEVKSQQQELKAAHRELRRQKSQLDLAERRLSDGDHMLEAEMISRYEYNLLELNYYQAAADLLNSYYDYRRELVEMTEAVGKADSWFRGELF
ncbi:TolC family protein [Halarsenatibacter silvermanii]|uniref:Outer membrane protein TolC n=1 Tax=Halarsenatibacter silvermanii TaxID=321763 RepID=A0A1G9KZU4_9FIRM|nr:TolC family protein [Halarsenatibacter silvermanii]SDL54967.1 Outer membrane protein TolC [Halarsenatibacter silvermanii]